MALSFLCALAMLVGTAGDDDGFVPLLANDSLAGWVLEGADKSPFALRDGVLSSSGEANWPARQRSEKTYENFILRFEYLPSRFAETVIYLHAPLHGRAAQAGFAIRVASATRPSGILVGVSTAGPKIESDDWRRVEIVMDWPTLRASVNGQVVTDVNCEKDERLRYRLRSGHLGIADIGYAIQFRNLRIKELPPKEKWARLFDGRSLDGWDATGDADWQVRDGVIRATQGNGYLVSRAEYADYELFALVRVTGHGNSGIFFGWTAETPGDRQGHEVQIYNVPDAHMPTGSLYGLVRADALPVRDDEWFPMQILVKGRTAIIRVNGETVAASSDLDIRQPGKIALQKHPGHGTIEFKDIRIQPR